MKKKVWIVLALLMIIPGLLFSAACTKQTVQHDESVVTTDDSMLYGDEAYGTEDSETLDGEVFNEETDSMAGEDIIQQDIYFGYDSFTLTEDAQDTLRQIAVWLRNNPEFSIVIEGHCDERGTEEYNIALGDRRSDSVKTFLMAYGIDSSSLSTVSYGEEFPVADGYNEEAWSQNRRVHFRLR
jgi:peptidoglycan-associated lipoprotein